jgi:hypothetical protein
MAERAKIEPKKIRIHKGRVAFFRAHEPIYRTNKQGQVDKGTDAKPKKPRYGWTWLLDPTDKQAQATIAEIKAEAARLLDYRFGDRAGWPKDNAVTGTKGVLLCFGDGNLLNKVYDGFKDMWYLKVSDTERPLLGTVDGREVQLLKDGQWHISPKGVPSEEIVSQDVCPYAGAWCAGNVTLYTYNYENQQAGVNANAISCQFRAPGAAFGGGAKRDAKEEFEAYGEYTAQNQAAADPFA